MSHVHAKVLKFIRTAVGDIAEVTHRSDAEFLAINSFPSPSQMLLAERLALLCRIVASGTLGLKIALVAAANGGRTKGPRSWSDGVLDQLEALVCNRSALAMLMGQIV